jgi:hypothetical protein
MTRYDDFWVRMPQRFERALQKCGTDAFLAKAGGIVDEFHKGVRGYDGSSEEQFRQAYIRSTQAMAPRLLVPFASMKPIDPGYQDHMEFFQRHLDCLRARGLSDGEVVDAVAAQACILLQKRGAAP